MTGESAERKGTHPLADIDRVVHGPARLMVMTSLYVLERADKQNNAGGFPRVSVMVSTSTAIQILNRCGITSPSSIF